MEKYYQKQLSQLSDIMKNEEVKEAISKLVAKKAIEENIRICKLLDELPSIIEWNMKEKIYQIQYEMQKPQNIDEFIDIEFVELCEKPWALCGSNVVLKINGKEIEFHRILSSGGHYEYGEDEYTTVGPWHVGDLPEYLEKYEKEITEVINKNVEWGCCGGCI